MNTSTLARATFACMMAIPAIATGQTQGLGRIELVVTSTLSRPLPFSTIHISPGDSHFTSEDGRLRFEGKAGSSYRLRITHLGFQPLDTAITVSGSGTQVLQVALKPISFTLAPTRVVARSDCRKTDSSAKLGLLLSELQKNAERDHILRKRYPFFYKLQRTYDSWDPHFATVSKRRDVATYRSHSSDKYVPGNVIRITPGSRKRSIREIRTPTLGDLADSSFLRSHCFMYAGVVDLNGMLAHKIDFEPTLDLRNSQDFAGSAWLDIDSYMIRRAEFVLTNGNLLRPPVQAYKVSTSFVEIFGGIALFDRIRSEQAMPAGGFDLAGRSLVDDQRLVDVRFVDDVPLASR